jgi:F420H(2)-dependent quinone reductase
MATSSKPFLPPRWFIRVAWAVHRWIYRLTGGRRGLRPPTAETYGLLRIHTIGRQSGEPRTAILGYYQDGPNLFTLAMNGWGAPEPAWWLNLQAHPSATIDLPEGSREITARAAVGEERERLWARMRANEPNLDAYASRRPTETAVIVFEPRTQADSALDRSR